MRTLDEVIKGVGFYAKLFEEKGCFECHYREDDCVKSCFLQDVLHYLREYHTLQYSYIKAMADLEDNPPLTFDELKQMEGKPVWYEHEFWKGWIILGKVEQGVNCEMIPDMEERWYIVKDGSAKAYRKERKATGGNLTPEPKSKKIGDYAEIKWRENEKLVN